MNIYRDIPDLKRTAIALGCFDGLHLGHLSVINAVLSRKDNSLDTTVFSFDDDILYKEGAEHIATFEDKCAILSDLGMNSLVIPSFDDIKDVTPDRFFKEILIQKLHAQLLVCGQNYRFGKNAAGNVDTLRAFCRQYGVELVVVSPILYQGEMISSSRIRDALKRGAVDEAEKMLGRPFGYCMEVIEGRQLGRQLGTPTINQYFPDHFLIPRYGVYASVTEIDGKRYSSVTNIGIKPTVGWHRPLSETWILDYCGNLYGQFIRVNPIKFMRDECRFHSVEELKKAILRDGVNARNLTSKYLLSEV